jgi:hypothetical protein
MIRRRGERRCQKNLGLQPNPAAATTITIKEITHNVPVDDTKFIPPPIQK